MSVDNLMSMETMLSLVRSVCPGCEPEVDPIKEMTVTSWCQTHRPIIDGDITMYGVLMTSTLEAGGGDNIRWCSLLHAGREEAIAMAKKKTSRPTKPRKPKGGY